MNNLKQVLKDNKTQIILLSVLVIGLVVAAVLVRQRQELRREAAENTVNFTFTPSNSSINAGENVEIPLFATAGADLNISAVRLEVQYDSSVIDLTDISPSALPVVLEEFADSNGRASVTFGVSCQNTSSGPTCDPLTGTEQLATLHFRGQSQGTGNVTLVTSGPGNFTQVTSFEFDTAASMQTGSATIAVSGTQTQAPTPTATSVPTTAPTNAPTATPTPTATADATPTSTPTDFTCSDGDYNNDSKLNILDYAFFFENFGETSFDERTDINSDGKVNILDYVIFFDLYRACP